MIEFDDSLNVSAIEETTSSNNNNNLSNIWSETINNNNTNNNSTQDVVLLHSEDFLELYLQKCSDYSIQKPCSRLIKEYSKLKEKG